ncbi:MAG: TIR domain protein [Methanocella sp. PtaU1.Bin125]|nr:MAG: TIR domain protein [Methanocella sp. PtaU1.Bin125]
MSYDVFISHSHKDNNDALVLYSNLKKNNIKCWIDVEDQIPSKNFEKEISDAIKASKLFLLLHSENSNKSRAVLAEVRKAWNREMPIISIKIQDTDYSDEIDYYLGSIQWIDASKKPIDNYIPKIINDIKALIQSSDRIESLKNIAQRRKESTMNSFYPVQKPDINPKGVVIGKVVTENAIVGLAHSFVAIVDASNKSIIYYKTTTDSQGFFQFNDINTTNGQRLYVLYAEHSLFGYGYSKPFSVDDYKNGPTPTSVTILPKPSHLKIFAEKDSIFANGIDTVVVWVYATDALNNPVSDECIIRFNLNCTSRVSGSLSSVDSTNPGENFYNALTVNGYAKARFGWAFKNGTNTITAFFEEDPSINDSIDIKLV